MADSPTTASPKRKPPSPALGSEEVAEIYADGMTQLIIGLPMTKLVFHTVIHSTGPGEPVKRAAIRIAIPTIAAIEMARNVISACKKEQASLEGASDGMRLRLQKLLSGVGVQDLGAVKTEEKG